MNDTLKRIGSELKRKFASSLKRPLNWNMIDALVKIEEVDEAKSVNKLEIDDPSSRVQSSRAQMRDPVRKPHDGSSS